VRRVVNFLIDYHHKINSSVNPNYHDTKGKVNYSISFVLSYTKLSHKHLYYIMDSSSQNEPQSYEKACKHPKWIAAKERGLKPSKPTALKYPTT